MPAQIACLLTADSLGYQRPTIKAEEEVHAAWCMGHFTEKEITISKNCQRGRHA